MSFPTFRAAQVQTNQIIVSGSNGSNARLLVYGSQSASNNVGGYTLPTAGIGTDVFLFISGSKDLVGLADTFGTTVFGGDLLVSGALVSSGNFYVYGNSAFHNPVTMQNIQVTGLLQLDTTLTSSNGTLLSGTVSNFEGVIDVSLDVEHGVLIREGLVVSGGLIAAINGTQLFVEASGGDPHSIKGDVNIGAADAGTTTTFANSSSFEAPVRIGIAGERNITVNGISLYVFSGSTITDGSGGNTGLLDETQQGANLALSDGSVAFYKFIGTAVAENGNAAATWEIDVSAFRSGVTVFASSTVLNKHTLGTNSNLAELFDVIVSSVNNGDGGSPGGIRFLVNDGTYGSNVDWWGKVIHRTERSLSGSFF